MNAESSLAPSSARRASVRPSASARASVTPRLVWEQFSISGLSIRWKLIGLMMAMALAIILPLAAYFPAREMRELRTARHERAKIYAALASYQLRSALAFADRTTAREVLSALAKDRGIDSVAVYSAGNVLYAEGRPSSLALRAGRSLVEQTTAYYLPGRILALAPIQSVEGTHGTVVLELSTRSLAEMQDRLLAAALWVGGGALAVGVLFAWLISRSLAHRIEMIADATLAMSHGQLEHQIEVGATHDELGLLAHAFNNMSRRVRELVEHIQRSASEESARLERLVSQRTLQLYTKNKDLRLVLDNADQGFVTIDRNARVVGEYSRAIEAWFGRISREDCLWLQLARTNAGERLAFEVAWEQVFDDLLPLAATLEQMPSRLRRGRRTLSLEYKAIGNAPFELMLVVISDVSAEVAREASEQESRELVNLTTRLVRNRQEFAEFFEETERLVRRVLKSRDDVIGLKRDLHTLKGNSALYGLARLSSACHELESALDRGPRSSLEFSVLSAAWEQCRATVQLLQGDAARTKIEVSEREYSELLNALQRGAPRAQIEQALRAWRLEPLRVRLTRVAEQLRITVARLGKGAATVDVSVPELYLGREELGEFWSAFSHVVRNAAVHGLETETRRALRAQAGRADFYLHAGVEDERLFIQLADSGPGIDWEKVRERAAEHGLAHDTAWDLEQALFADGFSTGADVTELSGRGVGLSAVRAACLRCQGAVKVTSERGVGTAFHFSWPAAQFSTLVQLGQRGAA